MFGYTPGREYTSFNPGPFEEKMTIDEARKILGLADGTVPEKYVREAHRRIMILNHPDSGGSTYLAIKINEAKAMLLEDQNKETDKDTPT